MTCPCSRTPFRIFVQALAQVHHIEAAPSRVSASRLKTSLPLRHYRLIHSSPILRREAEASVASDAHPAETSSDGTTRPQPASSGTSSPVPAKTYAVHESKDFSDHLSWRQRPSSSERARSSRKPKLTHDVSSTGTPRSFTPVSEQEPRKEQQLPAWRIQKEALKKKFPDGWKPRKRLSPDALAGIRALNAQFPEVYTTEALASKFEVPAEAIRRILRSKWQPNVEEEKDRQERWLKRGTKVWEYKAELGMKPPKKWREMGIAINPGYHERVKRAQSLERQRDEEEQRAYRAQLDRQREMRSGGGTGQGEGHV